MSLLSTSRTLRLVIVALAAPLSLAACKASSAERAAPERAATTPEPSVLPTVVTVQPRAESAQQRLRLPGTLEPWEHARLFAKVAGYVSEIGVDIGDHVKSGQVLARLSAPEMAAEHRRAAADLPAAEAQIAKAQADAALARVTYDRLAQLRERAPDAVTQQEVDVAFAKRAAAEAQIQADEAGLDVAQAKLGEIGALLSYATIKAPFSGVVTRRHADIGALVAQSAEEPIVEVSRIDKLRLALDLPEAIVPSIKRGQKVTFSIDAMPGQPFAGVVARTAGVVARDTRSMRIEIDVDNAGGELSAGMYAKVDISYGEVAGALTLPAPALRSSEGASHLLVAGEGNVLERVPVTLLMDDGAEVVVLGQNLVASSRVVLTAPPGTGEGQVCNVREQAVAQK